MVSVDVGDVVVVGAALYRSRSSRVGRVSVKAPAEAETDADCGTVIGVAVGIAVIGIRIGGIDGIGIGRRRDGRRLAHRWRRGDLPAPVGLLAGRTVGLLPHTAADDRVLELAPILRRAVWRRFTGRSGHA